MKNTPFKEYLMVEENRRLFNQESLIIEFTEAICEHMETYQITRAQLAERLGRTKGYVSQVLNGSRNVTLRTIADITLALGVQARIRLVEQSTSMEDTAAIAKDNVIPWEDTPVYRARRQIRQSEREQQDNVIYDEAVNA